MYNLALWEVDKGMKVSGLALFVVSSEMSRYEWVARQVFVYG